MYQIKKLYENLLMFLKSSKGYIQKQWNAFINSTFSKNLQRLYPYLKIYVLFPVVCLLMIVYISPIITRMLIINKNKYESGNITENIKNIERQAKKLKREIKSLDYKLGLKVPWTGYIIINSSENEFSLYKYRKLARQGKCSTGSYILLKGGDMQQWMFKTPKGEFRVQGKTTSPVWIKPDWAFVEEGLPIPTANHESRYEYGVLGDYALSLGHGYLIHGTLYQRFLGLPVTHGCIRLNDDDLEKVYKTLEIGSKVYIF